MAYFGLELCGCWYPIASPWQGATKQYLPQVGLKSHTTILATTSRTVLSQTFVNSSDKKLDEVHYTFPLYDGVSGEKQQARTDYKEAVARGETAGLLEQLPEASDVFTTKIGNIPANEQINVEIVYLGELKHDSEADGARFTIPTAIAPRYGSLSQDSSANSTTKVTDKDGIQILVDIAVEESSVIRGVQSPTHPVAVTMGRTTTMHADAFDSNHASATLSLGSAGLDKDFVLIVLAKGQETPRALLESHLTIPNQRALMTTLVPKFNLPNINPEIVFVADRSGSMEGQIPILVDAMKVFLKSLPVSGVKFNICSFGSRYSFLFKKSRTYDESSLQEALAHLKSFGADFGGTEMLKPIKATVENRYKDMPLEVMLLTDGEIWQQQEVFDYVNTQKNVRFFTLGIGAGASTALVEGIARAGNGFAQFVANNEKMDKKLVRMLKGALTPHVTDYTLEVHYGKPGADDMADDDIEIVESFNGSTSTLVTDLKKPKPMQKIISLFDTSAKEEPTNPPTSRYDGLPQIDTPKVLQAPHNIPPLYPFNRTTVYLLLGPNSCQKIPTSVVLKGTSEHGPLQLEIPVQDVGKGQTIHQLAAKKAVHELEQGRGWITEAKTDGKLIKSKHEGRWDLIVERETVRLGVEFQVSGKFCSFVAVERKPGDSNKSEVEDDEETETESIVNYGDAGSENRKRSPLAAQAPTGLFGGRSRTSFQSMRRAAPAPSAAPPPPPFSAAPATAASFGFSAPRQQLQQQQQQQQGAVMGSFLANFSGAAPAKKKMQSPSASTSMRSRGQAGGFGGGGADGVLFGSPGGALDNLKVASPPKLDIDRAKETRSDLSFEEDCAWSAEPSGDCAWDADPPTEFEGRQAMTDEEKMHKLIEMQAFNGTWDTKDVKLWQLLGIDHADPGSLELTDMAKKNGKIVATVVAVAWLETQMKKEEEVWEMVVEKARNWLNSQKGVVLEELFAKAKTLIAKTKP